MDSSNQTDTPYYSPDCSEKEYGCTPIRTETIAIQTDPTEMIDITEEEPICAVDCETQTSVKVRSYILARTVRISRQKISLQSVEDDVILLILLLVILQCLNIFYFVISQPQTACNQCKLKT